MKKNHFRGFLGYVDGHVVDGHVWPAFLLKLWPTIDIVVRITDGNQYLVRGIRIERTFSKSQIERRVGIV